MMSLPVAATLSPAALSDTVSRIVSFGRPLPELMSMRTPLALGVAVTVSVAVMVGLAVTVGVKIGVPTTPDGVEVASGVVDTAPVGVASSVPIGVTSRVAVGVIS